MLVEAVESAFDCNVTTTDLAAWASRAFATSSRSSSRTHGRASDVRAGRHHGLFAEPREDVAVPKLTRREHQILGLLVGVPRPLSVQRWARCPRADSSGRGGRRHELGGG